MAKYRKKPIVIDAFKWDGTVKCLKDNIDEKQWDKFMFPDPLDHSRVSIGTLEGELVASKGDYIIKGVRGEYYSCKPDVFAKTYEKVNNDDINYLEPKGVYKANKQHNNIPKDTGERYERTD